jgi:catechol 2,3-dioxygenase-like lactoylglutathione lyase family enzyme
MIRPGKLHHASIRVTDLDRSRKFYEGLLGFAIAPRPDMGFPGEWYALGDSQLHLIATPKVMEGIDPTDPHFAIEVEDFEGAKKLLGDQGISFRDFATVLWIQDPDGYTVEIRQKES